MHARLGANLGRTVGPAAPIPRDKNASTNLTLLALSKHHLFAILLLVSSYISDCHLEGAEFLCPFPNNLSQITFGHNCCREHRLMLRDHQLYQNQDIQQPWELLGSSSLGTPSTSPMAGKHSLGFRSENQAQELLWKGTGICSRPFLCALARIQAQPDPGAVASCHSSALGTA